MCHFDEQILVSQYPNKHSQFWEYDVLLFHFPVYTHICNGQTWHIQVHKLLRVMSTGPQMACSMRQYAMAVVIRAGHCQWGKNITSAGNGIQEAGVGWRASKYLSLHVHEIVHFCCITGKYLQSIYNILTSEGYNVPPQNKNISHA